MARIALHCLKLVRCESLRALSAGPVAEHRWFWRILVWATVPLFPETIRSGCIAALSVAAKAAEERKATIMHAQPPDAILVLERTAGELPAEAWTAMVR